MNILILGTGGIGAYYGAKLLCSGNKVTFIARGKHLNHILENGLTVIHPSFNFSESVEALELNRVDFNKSKYDLIILTTKSNTTKQISQELSLMLENKKLPYIMSLQNGIENEKILCEYFPKDKIIGALTRKIGAHIVSLGEIKAIGDVETILGLIKENKENQLFIKELSSIIKKAKIKSEIVQDINKELWKKLIINNGVNAICALLKIKTGTLMNDSSLSKIVYGLMQETAIAAKVGDVDISNDEINSMFELIKNFDSIKPSMLVDREFKRELEIDEICNIVINYNSKQKIDSPYTKTISYILEYTYKNEK